MTGVGAVARGTYLERLDARIRLTGSVLCVGIDPDPDALPEGFTRDARGIGAFARLVLEAAGPSAAAVKVNVAFFERWGSAGIRELEGLRALVPPDLPFIADAKRGDIGSTAEQYASALFDALDADAVTVSPYLGAEAIRPLLDRPDRFAYVLCRTSNPGAGELQELMVEADATSHAPAEPLAHRVARRVAGWEVHHGTVGLVVGATAPVELERVRAIVPGLPFLVPGVGAQGGDADGALTHGPATEPPGGRAAGGALLINVSRGIAGAATGARRSWGCGRRRRGELVCQTQGARMSGPPNRVVASEPEMDMGLPNIGPVELDHHPGHRPADPGSRQAARGRCRVRQDHPGVPQGVLGHPGHGQPRDRPLDPSAGSTCSRRPGSQHARAARGPQHPERGARARWDPGRSCRGRRLSLAFPAGVISSWPNGILFTPRGRSTLWMTPSSR